MKRFFDILFSLLLLLILGWFVLICIVISSFDTQSFGVFRQDRIGQFGRAFVIFKLKTMHPKTEMISKIGIFFRKYKIDELPQLANILIGNMSFVGYRPDIAGYYDELKGDNRQILNLKPGLTSYASIKYADEEELLASVKNPKEYNDNIIFPDKIKMNLDYYNSHNLWIDMQIIIKTIKNIL